MTQAPLPGQGIKATTMPDHSRALLWCCSDSNIPLLPPSKESLFIS